MGKVTTAQTFENAKKLYVITTTSDEIDVFFFHLTALLFLVGLKRQFKKELENSFINVHLQVLSIYTVPGNIIKKSK